MSTGLTFSLFFLCLTQASFAVDWSAGARISIEKPRENLFELPEDQFLKQTQAGMLHALHYPVKVTGLLVPYEPLVNFLEADQRNPLRRLLSRLASLQVGFSTVNEMYDWLGLNDYNDENATGIYQIPYLDGVKPNYPMGATMMETAQGTGLTFSCATCHSASLFGVSVFGLTNKRPRANEFFHLAKKYIPNVPSRFFQAATGATDLERKMFQRTKTNLGPVHAKKPETLGLDTSLAQVAMSLARRSPDKDATRDPYYQRYPRPNELERHIADSKPMVWWNLKYKNRWLADGSIVSGNPIHTNFLWNEIGRGTDLVELEKWLGENQETIDQLTIAAFATKPPLYTDFFDVTQLSLPSAKRGQEIFRVSCKECHGDYQKGWESQRANELTAVELFTTTKVSYHEQTPVKNVGTDPGRYQGMKYFSDRLNTLRISEALGVRVVPQEGYVPPPLEGIWARYPYFHNNSIPNLCALMTPPAQRPKVFYQGPAVNPETDYDQECIGYPVGDAIPTEWKKEAGARFETSRVGLSNQGHYKMFLDDLGNELYTPAQKRDLLEFLRTL